MQAEHIPVHLGSMPDAVAAVLGERAPARRCLDPQRPLPGGTHLPDITLISPIFTDDELLGFAASRAHHADVGGPTPAGMPVDSTVLDEEGVVIPPTRGRRRGLERLAAQMRNPRQRLADLRAQRAANLTGDRRLLELAEPPRARDARGGMAEILDYAERPHARRAGRAPRRRLRGRGRARGRRRWLARRHPAAGHREDRRRAPDTRLHRHRSPGRGQPQLPPAGHQVRRLLRGPLLTDPDAPPSAGAFRPVEVIAPEGCLCMRGRLPRSPPATSRPPAGSPTS